MNRNNFVFTCKRCFSVKKYKTEKHFRMAFRKDDCFICERMPDDIIKYFIESGKYVSRCPSCNNIRFFKTRHSYLESLNENRVCKSCNSIKNGPKSAIKIKKWWADLSNEKRKRICDKKSISGKRRWDNLSETEKKKWIESGKRQLKRIQILMKTPEYKKRWLKKLRASFNKYRGDNHWMKRPEIHQKVVNSCAKYKGDGHWLKNPVIYEKWLKTIRSLK